ncbi:MAG: hypothetical protein D6761_03505, partial [Candidatus Dadabacteria bacterium]
MKHAAWLLLPVISACASKPEVWPCAELAQGAVVVSEAMVNPAGIDGPGEWIELAGAGHGGHLGGLVLAVIRDDGRADGLMLPDLYLAADERVVLSSASPASLPTFASWSFADQMAPLPNTALTIELRCGATIIDRARLPAPTSGHSLSLDGRFGADASANDRASAWCASATAMNDTEFGTPGRVNEMCPPPAGWCSDDGATTQPVTFVPRGAIRITEVFPDPVTQPDTVGEWLELIVQAGVDLAAVQIATNRSDPTRLRDDGRCDRSDHDRRILLRPDGGERSLRVPLGNSGVTVTVLTREGIIDQVAVPPAQPGRSWMRDHEEPATWCWSDREGPSPPTPGAPNGTCTNDPGHWCQEDGIWRRVRTPAPGALRITEIMASPAVTRDVWGDWFEVVAMGDTDLAGLEIHNDPETDTADIRLPDDSCLPVRAGDRLIFARSADRARNGGLPHPVGPSPALPDAGQLLLTSGGRLITSTTWDPIEPGHTFQLDPETGAWCSSPDAVTGGTPGQTNPPCPRADAEPPDYFGQVQITELMIDGRGRDPDGEYIELRNRADQTTDLLGCTIGVDGQRPLVFGPLPLGPDQIAVLARPAAGITRAVASPPFTLGNTGGLLALRCGDRLIDQVSWRQGIWPIDAAVSWQRGINVPATAPADPRHWCPSTSIWSGGLGSPGLANTPCPLPVAPAPTSGQVIVNEIMHSPTGPDSDGEYVELWNISNQTVDLLGCLLRRREGHAFRLAASTALAPGDYFLITAPGRTDGL